MLPNHQDKITSHEFEPNNDYILSKLQINADGSWLGILRVNEGGRQLCLPIITNPDNRDNIEHLLEKIGCINTEVTEQFSSEFSHRFDTALNFFPPIIAMNFAVSPTFSNIDLSEIKPPPCPTPIIVPDASPRSGKTAILAAVKVVNPDAVEIVDFDPYTNQSLTKTFDSLVRELQKKNIDPFKSISRLVSTAIDIYFQNINAHQLNPTLGELLDQATSMYLENDFYQGKIAVIADVSGILPTTKRWSPSRILCKILPSITLESDRRESEKVGMVDDCAKRSALMLKLHWMYDRIVANLGNQPVIAGNEDQQLLAINQAIYHQKMWKQLVSSTTN